MKKLSKLKLIKILISLFSIALALFLMVFSFDVFLDGGSTATERFIGFIIHSIPTWTILTTVAIAWKYPKFGAWAFIFIALFFSVIVFKANQANPDLWIILIIIPFPLFLISFAYLYLLKLEKKK